MIEQSLNMQWMSVYEISKWYVVKLCLVVSSLLWLKFSNALHNSWKQRQRHLKDGVELGCRVWQWLCYRDRALVWQSCLVNQVLWGRACSVLLKCLCRMPLGHRPGSDQPRSARAAWMRVSAVRPEATRWIQETPLMMSPSWCIRGCLQFRMLLIEARQITPHFPLTNGANESASLSLP